MKKKLRRTAPKNDPAPGPAAPWPESQACWLLPAILLLALLLRLAALKSLAGSVYIHFPLWDEALYHDWARQIAAGTYAAKTAYSHAPLPAYLMAAIYWLFSPDLHHIRILNLLLGVLTCWAVYLTGRALADRTVGLISCLAAALYQPLILYSVVPMNTALSVLLFALFAWLAASFLREASLARLFGMGAALGLLVNVRGNALALIPLTALLVPLHLALDRARIRRIAAGLALFTLGLVLALGPFALRNYRVAGQWTLTTSQSGFALYTGNRLENPDPYYRPAPFAEPRPDQQLIQMTIEASRRAGHRLSAPEASSFWAEQVKKALWEQPAAMAAKLGQKALAVLSQSEMCDHYHLGFLGQFAPFFRWPLPGLWLVLPLGLAGMIRGSLASRRLFFLSLIPLAYGATLVLFFPGSRLRLPVLPLLIPFAVLGALELANLLRQGRRRSAGALAALIALFVVAEWIPLRAADDLSGFYNTHAIALHSRGYDREALSWWKRSSELRGSYSAFADLALARAYAGQGRPEESRLHLERIADTSFAAAAGHALRGDLLARENRLREAAAAYERALAVNAGLVPVWQKLVRLYELGGDRDRAARARESLRYFDSFYVR